MKMSRYSYIFTGLAIFSMFFGAGNVVFPLALGQGSGDGVLMAVTGLFFTGILLPLAGLISMILFNGDYYAFFSRIGRIPGLFLIFLIMALIGPFAGIPRTITLSYSTLALTWVDIPAWAFNLGFSGLVLLLAYRRDAVLGILGKVLTPLLLGFLAWTVLDGLMTPAASVLSNDKTSAQHLFDGFVAGYNTMDMLAGLFFSTVVLAGLHAKFKTHTTDIIEKNKTILNHLLKGAAVAAGLLFAVYGGFCYIAAKHTAVLAGVPADELLGRLALHLLGNETGLMANGVVAIACLTTAVSLTAVFSEFLSRHFFNDPDKMYKPFVILTAVVGFSMSLLGFMEIIRLIFPFIALCYPLLIVLAFCNIGNKLFGFKMVKIPVYGTLLLTALWMYTYAGLI
jgi:LIVCS family branched-chain amino acid:cation transporter